MQLFRGRDGRDGLPGRDGQPGEKGVAGSRGGQGPPGHNSGGVTYVRWGRTNVTGTELVYRGKAAGSYYIVVTTSMVVVATISVSLKNQRTLILVRVPLRLLYYTVRNMQYGEMWHHQIFTEGVMMFPVPSAMLELVEQF